MSPYSPRPFTPADAPAWIALTNPLLGRTTLPERLLLIHCFSPPY